MKRNVSAAVPGGSFDGTTLKTETGVGTKYDNSRASSKHAVSVTVPLNPDDNAFTDASLALRKALETLSELEVKRSREALRLEEGINFYETVRHFEISLIEHALLKAGGKQTRAASLLGLNVTTLNSKIKCIRSIREDP